jgi:Uma2 family endonuclease
MGKALISRPKTAVEVFKLLPEGVYCQVIDNVIYMSPAPTFEHQDIVLEIGMQLRQFINKEKLGKCVASPVDVFLDERNAFQPDILFIATENLSIVKDGKVMGAPDIIVEVLSKATKLHDGGKKKVAYERNGVKEYFLVEQKTKEVTAFYLAKDKYQQQEKVKNKIISKLLKKTFKF